MKKLLLIIIIVNISTRAMSQAANSVLAAGNWYKVTVTDDGIYRLTYSDLQSLGINVNSIDPRNIHMYGNGGGMLPNPNYLQRPDDLKEIAIKVIGESDGVFDSSDFVLFYGQSQHRWQYGTDTLYHHIKNIFSDTTCYFITTGLGAGKRINTVASSAQTATDTVVTYDDYIFHELDSVNFLKSGKEWYGEEFSNANPSRTFTFIVPDLSSNICLTYSVLGRSFSDKSTFQFIAGTLNQAVNILKSINSITADYGHEALSKGFFYNASDTVAVQVSFSSADPVAMGWLNYLELNFRRLLSKKTTQFFFRDRASANNGAISEFIVSNTSAADIIWDVTNHSNVAEIQSSFSSGQTTMRLPTDSLREFAVFNPGTCTSPTLTGTVSNQNLHGLPQADLIIVTHPDFVSAANTLANHHRTFDGMTVNVASTNQIYNEFSSGAQDITAIRDFIRMFYTRATLLDTPKYVLFFGDASYDYKNRIPGNSNYVPTYESAASLNLTTSYSSDDFFGLLDDNEGNWSPYSTNELVDLSIGRLPNRSLSEANAAVNKIIHYQTASDFGNWRKDLVLVADDRDQNTHLAQTEAYAYFYDTTYCEFDILKVYLDAYTKLYSPDSYPDVNKIIDQTTTEGCLMIIYTGQGGSYGWAQEQVLTKNMIKGWNNINNLPFFVSFPDEFNRYDNPFDTTAGELLLLNSNGGGIAAWADSRISFSGSNFSLMQKFNKHALEKTNGKYNRLGDIIKLAKREYNDRYVRNVTLLGDPAVQLKYPENNIVLTTFNGNPISGTVDTLLLGNSLSASGEIQNFSGALLNTFNGNLHVLLLREKTDTTLANDMGSYQYAFNVWTDTLYDSIMAVTGGTFSFSFNIPSNANIYYRKAKFSFYADNGVTDATGCYPDLVIGNFQIDVPELNTPTAQVTIFPNPVIKEARVHIESSQAFPLGFLIYDMEGRILKNIEKVLTKDFTIRLDDLSQGIYMYELKNMKQQQLSRGKIIVE